MSMRERSSRRPKRLTSNLCFAMAEGRRQKAEGRRPAATSAFCPLPSAFRSRIEIVAFQYPIQDAVDELRRLIRPELLGDLDSLIDDDELRSARLMKEFVDRHPDCLL